MALSNIIQNRVTQSFRKFKEKEALNKKVNPDVLIIHGFWRSGTTFFQEFIQATFHTNVIFEPLNEITPESKELMDDLSIKHGKNHRRLIMPDFDISNRKVRNWQIKLLTGKLTGDWVRTILKFGQIGTYNSDRLVVKFVNAAFFMQHFENLPKVILIRDLMGTMGSFKKTSWTSWFEELDLYEHLPKLFFTTYGNHFNALIDRAQSDKNPLIKIGLFKLLSDFFAVSNKDDQTLIVQYEVLKKNPEEIVHQISDLTGWNIRSFKIKEFANKASTMTVKSAKDGSGVYKEKRSVLTDEEITKLTQLQNSFEKLKMNIS